MSNYTGKRRAGGGLLYYTDLRNIQTAVLVAADTIEVNWNANVDPDQFSFSNFITAPDGHSPTGITSSGMDTLLLAFPQSIDDQTSLTYRGAIPNLQTPDTKTITE
jgi:hypothetical protein